MPIYRDLNELPNGRDRIADELLDGEEFIAATHNSHYSARMAERGGIWASMFKGGEWTVLTDQRLIRVRPFGNVLGVDLSSISSVSFRGSNRFGGKLVVETTAAKHKFRISMGGVAGPFAREVRQALADQNEGDQ